MCFKYGMSHKVWVISFSFDWLSTTSCFGLYPGCRRQKNCAKSFNNKTRDPWTACRIGPRFSKFSRFWSGPRFLNLFDPGLGPNFSVRNQPVLVRGSLNKTVKKEFTAESSAILKWKSRFFVLNGQKSKATSAVGFDDLARTGYNDSPLNPDGNIRFWNGSFHCRSIPTVENKNNQFWTKCIYLLVFILIEKVAW